MSIGTWFYTKLFGKKIGEDQFGNRYYVGKKHNGKQKRWVIYNGDVEASKVPAEWHGWLHYTVDVTPLEEKPEVKKWQQPHKENKTGTEFAYLPDGHMAKGGSRPKTTGDYESWVPPK